MYIVVIDNILKTITIELAIFRKNNYDYISYDSIQTKWKWLLNSFDGIKVSFDDNLLDCYNLDNE